MAAHLVTPRKIRLTSRVELVPQLGHEHPLTALAFGSGSGLLAALDARPSVHVWGVEPSEVLLIAPLPTGRFDAVHWLDAERIAARQCLDEGGVVWWARRADRADRWRPLDDAEAPGVVGVLSVERAGAGLEVVHTSDGRRVALAQGEATATAVDPLGRYVVLAVGASVRVFDAERGGELHEIDGGVGSLLGMAVTPGGDSVVLLGSEGRLSVVDPMRGGRARALARVAEAQCLAIDGSEHVAVGDSGGQVTVLSLEDGQRLVRTPKCVRGFVREVALCEQIGFLGARPESFTAYLEPERAIQPVRPMPGTARAVCAGAGWPLVLVSLEDGRLFELNLLAGTATELGRSPFALTQLAASQFGAVGVGEGGCWWFDGERGAVHALEAAQEVRCVAVDRKGSVAALGYPSRVVVLGSSGKVQSVIEGISSPRSMGLLKYRNKRTLVVVDEARVLWRVELGKEKLVRAGVVELVGGQGGLAVVDSLVVDEDETLRGLVEIDNAHRAVVTIDVQSGQATLELGVVVHGPHVVAVYDDEGTWLRQDEQRSVRMVSELSAYEPHDWLRQRGPGEA